MEKFSDHTVPVILAANNHYLPFLYITIVSLSEHISPDREYRIFILHTDLEFTEKEALLKLEKENLFIRFIDVSDQMSLMPNLQGNFHISKETYYRFFITALFPEYPKVIYLDCDLLVRCDIAALMDIDLGSHLIGAVQDYGAFQEENYIQDTLHIKPLGYINAGVLLINNTAFAESNIPARSFALLCNEKKYRWMDQDVLNLLCANSIHYLPPVWNFQARNDLFRNLHYLPQECKEEYLFAANQHNIIHYNSGRKPWKDLSQCKADLFWQYAEKTLYYKRIKNQYLEDRNAQLFRYQFPYGQVRPGDRIVLYGAGAIGRAFKQQLFLTGYCTVCLWADKNYKKLALEGVGGVSSPSAIISMNYDKIVIAVGREELSCEIKNNLQKLMVEEEKMVWQFYEKG